MTFLWALIVSLFGAQSLVIDNRKTSYIFHAVIRCVVYLVLIWLIQYKVLITFDGIRTFTVILCLFLISNGYDLFINSDCGDGEVSNSGLVTMVIGILVLIALPICTSDCGHADTLYQKAASMQVDASKFNQNPVDENHIRVVPRETALRIAREKISSSGQNYGAYYQFEDATMTIQKVNDRLYWVAPMEFGGFFKSMNAGKTSPGYIMISAEDETEKPRLITKKADKSEMKMLYLMSAYFGNALDRYLYNEHPDWYLADFSFEIDEQLNPWQVVTVLDCFKGYDYYTIKGVLVVNPETGAEKFYKVNDIPNWVDRAVPQELAIDYFKWWGTYKHGWMNNVNANPDLKKPTEIGEKSAVEMVWGSDGEPYWFTGFTSMNDNDQSLVGKAFMDSRTGKFFFLPASGATEERIESDILAALGKQVVEQSPTEPIPYNMYGQPNCWAAQVISMSGKSHSGGALVKIAIVNGDTSSPPILADSKKEALTLFKKTLSQRGIQATVSDTSEVKEYKGKIDRLSIIPQEKSTSIRFSLEGMPLEFACDVMKSDQSKTSLTLAKPGDVVSVKYFETKERVVTVDDYTVEGQSPIISPNQERSDEMMRQQEELEQEQDPHRVLPGLEGLEEIVNPNSRKPDWRGLILY